MSGLTIRLIGNDAMRERLAAMPQQISKALDAAMARSLDVVARRVTFNLTGTVLRVKTGRLRQSIQTQVNASDHSGIIGTNVEYAAAHEYGFHGSEQVRPYTRRSRKGLKLTQVASYSRSMEIPERPYMRPALADSQEQIVGLFRAGLASALGAK